jgi:hypothetical protein
MQTASQLSEERETIVYFTGVKCDGQKSVENLDQQLL